jgi:hypothetical protein
MVWITLLLQVAAVAVKDQMQVGVAVLVVI